MLYLGVVKTERASLPSPSTGHTADRGGPSPHVDARAAADRPAETRRAGLSLPLVYEDEALLVVDKPSGQPVHPSPSHRVNTLIQELREAYAGRAGNIKLAHRIDRETSGLLVATKDDECNDHLHTQFRERRAHKVYLAIVVGHIDPPEGSIELPLGLVPGGAVRVRMWVRADGAPCHTVYRTVATTERHSLLEIELLTGRQHQIRAHLAHVGHPLVGDKIYGPSEQLFLAALRRPLTAAELQLLELPRHALHSHRLVIEHPWYGRQLELQAPLPADLRALLGGGGAAPAETPGGAQRR